MLNDLAAALGAAGLVTPRYFRSGNWYDDTRGLAFRDYLAQRPAVLRHTFRRRSVPLERAGAVRLATDRDGALGQALDAYERIYAASGARAEPYPGFIRLLAAVLADAGTLRRGLLSPDERPVAAQIWIVRHGTATLYKLAHDRACDALSPGTVLIMGMLERLFDDERITGLDLGAGDDSYQRLWASRRRERCGLLAFDLLTVRGGVGILRHVVLPGLKAGPGDRQAAAQRQPGIRAAISAASALDGSASRLEARWF